MDKNERILVKVGAIVGWGIALAYLWPLIPLAILNRVIAEELRRKEQDHDSR